MILYGWSLLLVIGCWGLYTSLRRPAQSAAAIREARARLRTWLVHSVGLAPAAPPEGFLALSLGLGLAAAHLAQTALGWPLVSLFAGLLGGGALAWLSKRRQGQRRAEVQAALVESIGQLRGSLAASQSVQQALMELATSSPPALRPEFRSLARDIHRMGLVPALRLFRERMADPVVNRFIDALILNDATGGRLLGPMLEQLARSTRAQLLLQDELRAEQSDLVLQAQLSAATPWLLLVAIRVINPAYLASLDSPLGQVILAFCGLLTAAGYLWMRWLGRLPDERRGVR